MYFTKTFIMLYLLYHVAFSCMKLPTTASFDDYVEYIKDLPLNDDSSLFGMHSNADINCAQAEAYACLATLSNMQSKDFGAATANVEEVTSEITNDMLAIIPELFDLIEMQMRYYCTIFFYKSSEHLNVKF